MKSNVYLNAIGAVFFAGMMVVVALIQLPAASYAENILPGKIVTLKGVTECDCSVKVGECFCNY